MKATRQIIYTDDYSANSFSADESFSYLKIQADSISFGGKFIPFNSNFNSTIASVKEVINDSFLTNEKIPSVLLLDLGLGEIDVQELVDFLKNRSKCNSEFQVLWNAAHLNISDTQHLLQLGIVDDFIEDISDTEHIKKKIKFLIKYKQSTSSLKLFDNDYEKSSSHVNDQLMFFKRLFDILISSILLILLIPIFILVGLAIKIESRGPILYISKRVGRHYKVFPMIKFRSMREGADHDLSEISHLNMYGNETESAAFFKIKNDPRVSEVGKFLRKTSIDEFPQLLNVLLGHMSIVGNRPLPLYEAEKLLVNDYVSRFDAPAGITGLWQVVKKGKPDMNEQERIQLDIMYSKECSFLKDLWIILKTPGALLQNQNY
jgi:lipopolysaccharide/colanic/teichoic acid biosynthesis glycosyltransferase